MAGRGAALSVDGARQLRAALKRAGVDVQDLKDAHRQVADLVVRAARPVAPVRTGRLAASLRPSGTQRASLVRAGSARVPYAGPIHFGWPSRRIAAQPFITDAAERSRDSWERLFLTALDQIITSIERSTP